jgi:hypothetical protein
MWFIKANCFRPDVPSYAKALKNVVSLLKPGGMLVLMGVFDNAMYTVGHKAWYYLFYLIS